MSSPSGTPKPEGWDNMTRQARQAWREGHGAMPVDPTPTQALYAALRSRERVRIVYPSGGSYPVRCYVGMSMGWRPCFLEIKTSRSLGGAPLYVTDDMRVEVVHPRRYR
jgi:hypothetical protein